MAGDKNLQILTDLNRLDRKDVPLQDPTLADPKEAAALLQGEWVTFDASGKKALRVTASTPHCYQVFTNRGDTASQAIGKVAILFLNDYEADTVIFADGLTPTVGQVLTVKSSTVGGVANRAALATAAPGDFPVAVVTRVPAENGGKLRFRKITTGAALA